MSQVHQQFVAWPHLPPKVGAGSPPNHKQLDEERNPTASIQKASEGWELQTTLAPSEARLMEESPEPEPVPRTKSKWALIALEFGLLYVTVSLFPLPFGLG